jgi:pyrimidine deaminase RibD-like protein
MSATVDFYLSRAAESAKAAAETTLDNVRQRCLRSEAAWRVMADRLTRTEAQKQQHAEDKARAREEQA